MQPAYSDQEILNLLQTDGEKAIELIFRQYYQFLCLVVYKILPDQNLVEDLAQEVFYELWRKKDKIKVTTSLKAYLRRAAVNKTLNYIRDQKIKFDDEAKLQPIASSIKTSTRLESKELQGLIDQAINRLPERCRIVFALSRFEGFSYQEIAQELGISVKTVENQISKALRLLRAALDGYISES